MIRKILVMIGSDSDLPQCAQGLRFLDEADVVGAAKVKAVITASIHRNMDEVREHLWNMDDIDVLVTGAGMANQLTGADDAYLRYMVRNKKR